MWMGNRKYWTLKCQTIKEEQTIGDPNMAITLHFDLVEIIAPTEPNETVQLTNMHAYKNSDQPAIPYFDNLTYVPHPNPAI